MMTTPRVTEIPRAMAPVEADPFIDVASRVSVVRRRLAEREARKRRTELVKRLMRMRAAQRHRGA
jgi:hypothetical protein